MPTRTCVVCKEVAEKRFLVRFCETEAGVLIDEDGTNPGRGAYCHRDCMTDARLGKQLFGSFRRAERNREQKRRVVDWSRDFKVENLLGESEGK